MKTDWTPYRGERYLDLAELEAWCRQTAAAHPGWVKLETVGTSRLGRPQLLLTLADQAGRPDEQPAFWLDGGTHCAEWTGIMAALYAISRWVEALASGDAAAADWFRRHTVYVLPCISPDGFQHMMAGHAFVRSTLRPPLAGTHRTGLDARDLDGDGLVAWMRWKHPAGPFVIDPELPSLMRPRRLDDDPADAYFVCDEGEFVEWDGVSWKSASLQYGLDLNRSFPSHWEPFRMFGMDGGDIPMSEPESRNVVEAFRARPNVAAAVTNHTYTGCLLTQPSRENSPLPSGDVELMFALGKEAVEGTGWRVLKGYPDFMYDPKRPLVGTWDDTLAVVFGVPGYTLELWDPFGHAGLKIDNPASFFVHPDNEIIRKMIQKFAEDPAAVVPWRPFLHPQLGPVEIGGIDYMRTVRNPPVKNLAAECEKGFLIADRVRRAVPRLELDVKIQKNAGVTVVTAVADNTGFLSTSGLSHAESKGMVSPNRLEITLGAGLHLIEGDRVRTIGQQDGWGATRHAVYPSLPDRGHRGLARWVVAGEGELVVRLWSARAGVVETRVTIG